MLTHRLESVGVFVPLLRSQRCDCRKTVFDIPMASVEAIVEPDGTAADIRRGGPGPNRWR